MEPNEKKLDKWRWFLKLGATIVITICGACVGGRVSGLL